MSAATSGPALAGYDHLLRAAARLSWDEAALPLAADRAAWLAVDEDVRAPLRRLMAGFCVAEGAVAAHLAPFADAAADPVLAECFAAQARDEARHARFFARAAAEVAGLDPADHAAVAGPGLVRLFAEDLPETAAALARGDVRLSAGVGLYHLVLEGIVFAAGQEALLERLEAVGTLPVLLDGARRVAADERWHVGLGVRCLRDAGMTAEELAEVEAAAARAALAWGPEIAGPERVAAVLERHRRRVGIALA